MSYDNQKSRATLIPLQISSEARTAICAAFQSFQTACQPKNRMLLKLDHRFWALCTISAAKSISKSENMGNIYKNGRVCFISPRLVRTPAIPSMRRFIIKKPRERCCLPILRKWLRLSSRSQNDVLGENGCPRPLVQVHVVGGMPRLTSVCGRSTKIGDCFDVCWAFDRRTTARLNYDVMCHGG